MRAFLSETGWLTLLYLVCILCQTSSVITMLSCINSKRIFANERKGSREPNQIQTLPPSLEQFFLLSLK